MRINPKFLTRRDIHSYLSLKNNSSGNNLGSESIEREKFNQEPRTKVWLRKGVARIRHGIGWKEWNMAKILQI